MPLNHHNIKSVLGRISLFAGLMPEHRDDLVATSRKARFEKKQAIYRTGDAVDTMYFLLSGQVKLTLSSVNGREKVIDVVEPGRSFGEAELFGGCRSLTTATAIMPSQILCIAGDDIRRITANDPQLALRLMKMLAQQQLELESELAARYFRTGSQRLLDYFIGLAGPSRERVGETPITLRTSKNLLASRFDMKPETLSRALRDLTEDGLIDADGCQIRLINARIEHYLAHEDPARGGILVADRNRPRPAEAAHRVATSAPGPRSRGGDSPSLCDAINRAGRQRMLSQRMVKSWLMLKQQVLPRPARLVLRQSIELFDRQLMELEGPANRAESSAARAELTDVWQPYKMLLNAGPDRKTAHALYRMNEEVLTAAHKLTLSFEEAEGTHKGKLVNRAGRQRMLSQRIAKFFLFQHAGIQVAKCRTELEAVSDEFSTALVDLTAATQDKPAIAAELEGVAEQWSSLQSAVTTRNSTGMASARKVFTASENLLQRMDMAVEMYARLPG